MKKHMLWILCVLSLASSQSVVTTDNAPPYCSEVPASIARHDPCYRWVAKDPYCCEVSWDKTCLEAYNECAYGNFTGNVDGRVFNIEKYRDYIDKHKQPLDIYQADQPVTQIDNVNNYGEMVVGNKIVTSDKVLLVDEKDMEVTSKDKEEPKKTKKGGAAGAVLGFFIFIGAALGL
tara:strand:- start:94 stop:621 length:528 start_codon:yes stop_codon:yes gene_type:complete